MINIMIDAGHGTNTPGKRTPPFNRDVSIKNNGVVSVQKGEQYREHYANVMVACKLVEELERQKQFHIFKAGFNDADPSNDEDVSLSFRQSIAKNNNCDYTVSIHFNAYGNGETFNTAEGFQVYIHNKYANESKNLARSIISHLANGTKQVNRGIFEQGLAMCNCNTMGTKASVLVELAFMTNEREAHDLMANEKFADECAKEIAMGICQYFNIQYKSGEGDYWYKVQVGAFSNIENAQKLSSKLFEEGYTNFITKVKKS